MNPSSISKLISDTVPQLYESSAGKYPVDLNVSGETASLFSLSELSPALKCYLDSAAAIWEDIRPTTEGEISQIIEREWIQQKFVVSWLQSQTQVSSWPLILDYIRRLPRRPLEIPPSVAGSKSPRRQGVNLNRVTLSPALQQA